MAADLFRDIASVMEGLNPEKRDKAKELAEMLIIICGVLIDEADRRERDERFGKEER